MRGKHWTVQHVLQILGMSLFSLKGVTVNSDYTLNRCYIHWTILYTYPGYLLKAEIIAVKGKWCSPSPSFHVVQKWSPHRWGKGCLQLLPAEERTSFLEERRMLLNRLFKLPHLFMILCTCAQQKTVPLQSSAWLFVTWILCLLRTSPHLSPFGLKNKSNPGC